jgi:hypothetical protein
VNATWTIVAGVGSLILVGVGIVFYTWLDRR